jgi:hypothetical protein
VSHQPSRRPWFLAFLVTFLIALAPLTAEAQRRAAARSSPPRRPVVVHTPVVVVRGVSYPRYAYVNPWYDGGYYGAWYQYPYPPGPYRGYPYADPRYAFTSAVRIEVTPNDAHVFVDGYFAGEVDEFDNVFQSLRIRPGGHEIAIYREGYRTMRRSIYAEPGSTEHIRGALQPLGPDEISELPSPADAPPVVDGPGAPPPGTRVAPATPFGTLLLRVQPAGAEVFVDGEPWAAPDLEDRMAIRLPEGRHRIEVRREGYARYVEDVLIRRNATLTLNVSLRR